MRTPVFVLHNVCRAQVTRSQLKGQCDRKCLLNQRDPFLRLCAVVSQRREVGSKAASELYSAYV